MQEDKSFDSQHNIVLSSESLSKFNIKNQVNHNLLVAGKILPWVSFYLLKFNH